MSNLKKTISKNKNNKNNYKIIKSIFLSISLLMIIIFVSKISNIKNQIEYSSLKIPDSINKPFFMDNNGVVGDYIVNPANGYMVSENTLNIPVYKNSTFTFGKTFKGIRTMLMVYLTQLNYKITFNEDFTYGVIKPIIFGLFEIPSSLMNFTLKKIPDSNNWLRESTLFGHKYNYVLRDLNGLTLEQKQKIPLNALVFK